MVEHQQDLFTVKTDSQWRAVNSPVRVEMLVFMLMAGPCSIRELANLMNRPADGLYHHMRLLVRAGLVHEIESRKVGTQTEAVYRPAGSDITIDRNIGRKSTRERSLKLFRTMMQNALRTVEAAIESQVAVLEGPGQNFKLNWQVSWLNDQQLTEVKQHQAEIARILQQGMRQRQGQLIALLTYLSPVVRTRESRLSSDQEQSP